MTRGRRNFNPRSPRGERPGENKIKSDGFYISTLAPREGSDLVERTDDQRPEEFQPSLPARGATLSRTLTALEES